MASNGPDDESKSALVQDLQRTTQDVNQLERDLNRSIENDDLNGVKQVDKSLEQTANNLADMLEKKGADSNSEGMGQFLKRRAGEIRDIAKSKNARDKNSPLEHGGMLVNKEAKDKYGMKTGAKELDELIEELIENLIKALTVLPQRIYAFYAQKAQPEISMERDPSSAPPSPEPASITGSRDNDVPNIVATRENDSQADLLARLESTGNAADREASLTLKAAGEDKSQDQQTPSRTFTPEAEIAAQRAEQKWQEARKPTAAEEKPAEERKSSIKMGMGRGGGGNS